jgi:hypothetical protein
VFSTVRAPWYRHDTCLDSREGAVKNPSPGLPVDVTAHPASALDTAPSTIGPDVLAVSAFQTIDANALSGVLGGRSVLSQIVGDKWENRFNTFGHSVANGWRGFSHAVDVVTSPQSYVNGWHSVNNAWHSFTQSIHEGCGSGGEEYDPLAGVHKCRSEG